MLREYFIKSISSQVIIQIAGNLIESLDVAATGDRLLIFPSWGNIEQKIQGLKIKLFLENE